MSLQQKLRGLPSVHSILNSLRGKKLTDRFGHQQVADEIAKLLAEIRKGFLQNASDPQQPPNHAEILQMLEARIYARNLPNLRPVINATGVILHTNLGRAPLADLAIEQIERVARGYSNLEFDLENNRRGSRQDHIEALLTELTGAEAAMVVNNNAAAVLLVLSTMAAGKNVIISRGELVEIGGSFRIPDVMAQSGAALVEIGTTNKTHADDYRTAIDENTALLLKVHTSNYRIIGFTQDVSLEKLVQIGREHRLPVVNDLGSGSLIPLQSLGLPYEPSVGEAIRSGASVVTFSGDKLLGGPQAGIICGEAKWIQACRKHPLARALRIDKMTLAGLEATLKLYRDPQRAMHEIPVLRMLLADEVELHEAATFVYKRLMVELGSPWEIDLSLGESRVGGGALPEYGPKTWLIQLRHPSISSTEIQKNLLTMDPPILTRIVQDRIAVDPRTLIRLDEESAGIALALKRLLQQ